MTPLALCVVPVLGRPHRAGPLAASLQGSLRIHACHLLYVCSPSDTDEHAAVLAEMEVNPDVAMMTVPWEPGPGDFARKHNRAFAWAVEEGYQWVFMGADDLRFRHGWLDRALNVAARTGACVIGTNDLGNVQVKAGRHSTYSLVSVDYLECGTVDEAGKILYEGYDHNWVDNEFVETAKHRGTFQFARQAVVEHLHPLWRKSEMDSTYEKALREFELDRERFLARQPLWGAMPAVTRRRAQR